MSTDRDYIARCIAEYVSRGDKVTGGLLDQYWSAVPAHLFTDTDKWKYEVTLNYTDPPAGYIDPIANAHRAFEQACRYGESGVTMSKVPEGWRLVVFEPPEGYPVMVTGGPGGGAQ